METSRDLRSDGVEADYVPPTIERVVTHEELEREAMFAGLGITLGDFHLNDPSRNT